LRLRLKENFDRFNFAIYKEKEMVEFRRWITALAVLALFAGLASAQVGGGGTFGGPLQCTAAVAVPPQLRAEGFTELIGDIVLTCTGGTATPVGTAIPTANITVSLGTNVTSRILGNNGSSNSSEALLLIDEPGASLPAPVTGFGPAAPQTLCATANLGAGPGGCVEFAQNNAVNGGIIQTGVNSAGGNGANVFQGIVTGTNQVYFQGIPVLAPVTSGAQRVFRITNVRANVNGISGGGLAGTTQLLASISISGSTSLPINNPVQIAGFVQAGLTASVRNADSSGGLTNTTTGAPFTQCAYGGPSISSSTPTPTAVLRFAENFGTAFKTRVAPTGSYGSVSGAPPALQNVPGTIYNSESGFIPATFGGTAGLAPAVNIVAGLADYGTRLKAVFTSVPVGVRIYVSITNISNETSGNATSGNSSFAQLINGEVSPDANGFPPLLAPTVSVVCTSSSSCSTSSGTMGLYDITSGGATAGGTYSAVWEVINTVPSQNENLNFAVFTLYTPNPAASTPPQGTGNVNMSYAPTATQGAFTVTAGSAASSSLTLPRFADTSTAKAVLSIQICQTLLLFPFVTSIGGFDTGLAIANTSTDPIGTGPQAGACTLNWYGAGTPPPAVNTGNIPSGTVYTTIASSAAPGFQGYMFALCNFQFAHGFGIVSDIGLRNFAAAYLALVINNGAGITNRGQTIPAEDTAH